MLGMLLSGGYSRPFAYWEDTQDIFWNLYKKFVNTRSRDTTAGLLTLYLTPWCDIESRQKGGVYLVENVR